MRRSLFILILLTSLALPGRAAAPYAPSENFVTYMKSVLNPLNFGVRQDRYYPYLTPWGRRIGYGHTVDDNALYTTGWSKNEADRQLRLEIAASLVKLRAYLAKNDPAQPFDQLDPRSQEILLDFAVTEGAENIQPDFYTAVLHQDWDKLINGYLYIRGFVGWPNQLENRAFAQRWIYGQTPLLPLKK